MRPLLTILVCLMTLRALAQAPPDFTAIDAHARAVGFAPLEDLVDKIIEPCQTDLEKVRALFVWETEHIEYDMERLKKGQLSYLDDLDTNNLLNGNMYTFQVAKYVLEHKKALCGGYSRLFKAMCNLADIRCEVVVGYSFTKSDFDETNRVVDHGWNAVLIDDQWQLVDVTWASGNIGTNGFVKAFKPFYFLTPPDRFIYNHYPEDVKWALLKKIPTLEGFFGAPIRHVALSQLKIKAFTPPRGIIEAAVGDTIVFTLTTEEAVKTLDLEEGYTLDRSESDGPATGLAAKSPMYSCTVEGNKIKCKYPVHSARVKYLHLFHNEEAILTYRIKVR